MLKVVGMKILAFLDNASVMNIIAGILDEVDFVAEKRWKALGILSDDNAIDFVDSEIWKMRKYLRERAHHYDLVHTTAWRGGLAAYLEKIPYTLHLHGSDIRSDFWSADPLRRWAYRKVLFSAIEVAVSTPDLIPFVKIAGLEKRVSWIPNPVDPMFLKEPDEERIREIRENLLKERELLLFSPNRLDPIKGITTIFKAIKSLQREHNFTFVQINWTKRGGEAFLKELPDNTRLILPTKRKGFPAYLAASDIVIGQAKVGVYGMTEIEAAILGKPVTVYTNPSFYSEIPPFNPKESSWKSLRDFLEKLITEPEFREKYGREVRTYVMSHHSPTSVAQSMVGFWETAIEIKEGKIRGSSSDKILSTMVFAFDLLKKVYS